MATKRFLQLKWEKKKNIFHLFEHFEWKLHQMGGALSRYAKKAHQENISNIFKIQNRKYFLKGRRKMKFVICRRVASSVKLLCASHVPIETLILPSSRSTKDQLEKNWHFVRYWFLLALNANFFLCLFANFLLDFY